MIPEWGHFALIIAFAAALLLFVFPLWGYYGKRPAAIAAAKPLALLMFLMTLVSYAALTVSFATDDFSVWLVANNSNTALPMMYKLSGVWANHEGSLLLWVLILTAWTAAVALYSRQLPDDARALILAVLGAIAVGFIGFILLTSNPFARLLPYPAVDGRDLNPLLQDAGLVVHPPLLYMGYVGFAVAYAFAMSALLMGQWNATWARWTRPWTLIAWSFLTVGIALGSWWAYYELGWGGFWFWDPVENASLMPWLAGTALIHSLAVSENRKLFTQWTLLLAITTFSLSLLGTFLVRSGVLTSVHAFANDPERGLFILGFLIVVIGGSLGLFAWRSQLLREPVKFNSLSRESLLLANNIILIIACATVLLGTMYPLVRQAFDLGSSSVGPPYFNSVVLPLFAFLMLFLALGPMSSWKQMDGQQILSRLRWYFVFSVILAFALPLLFAGRITPWVVMGLLLSIWVILATFEDFLKRIHYDWRRAFKLRRAYYGMVLAHLGIAISAMGLCLTTAFDVEKDLRMAPGERVSISGYEFEFASLKPIEGSNYKGVQAEFLMLKNNAVMKTLYPEKRVYTVSQMPLSETAIDPGLFYDIYIALAEPIDKTSWAVRIYYKPFVRWIWLGGLFMMFGGLCAASDKRYRQRITVSETSEQESGDKASEQKPMVMGGNP